MEAIPYLLAALFGLFFGSFYNVVAIRIPLKQSIAFPPSHCPACGRRLASIELIPVLSHIWLRGRCRTCSNRISWLYPLGETLTALSFMLAYYLKGWTVEAAIALILFSYLILFTLTDLHYRLIPNRLILPALLIALGVRMFFPAVPRMEYVTGGLLGFLLLLAIAWLSRGGMGGGDIKLFAFIGLFIGWKGVLLSLVLASLAGTIYGVVLLVIGKYERKMAVPFAPFIFIGTVISYGWGKVWLGHYISWLIRV